MRSKALTRSAVAVALLLAGCGSAKDVVEQKTAKAAPTPTKSGGSNAGTDKGTGTASATPTPAKPTAPAYRTLGKPALTKALLGVQDMPPGYSQDPPSPASPNKTFCDYKPPFTEKVYVSRDFTKGGGLSAELLGVGLRQYASAKQAKAAFTALTDALETCTGETYQGTKLTYAPMSTAKIGDGSVGIKITADNTTCSRTSSSSALPSSPPEAVDS